MRKKIRAFIAVCLVTAGVFTSCSKDSKDRSSAGEKDISSESNNRKNGNNDSAVNDTSGDEDASEYIPKKPIGGDVTGNWEITDEGTGEIITLMLEKDGSGSVYIDTTKYLFLNKEGNLCIYGMDIGDNSVDFDGKTLTVTLNTDLLGDEIEELTRDATLMVLEKTEPGSNSELDGEYRFTGGVLGTLFSDKLTGKILGDKELPVYIRISGEDFGIKIDRLFTYSADGNTLTVSGTENFLEGADTDIRYSVSGDKLILYYLTGTKTFTRSKLK